MMWKDKYKIGVELIDQQHKELFRRVSDFTETIRNEENWEDKLDKVKETMAFMQEFLLQSDKRCVSIDDRCGPPAREFKGGRGFDSR